MIAATDKPRSGWRECKLSSIAEVQTGPFGSQLHQSDYKTSGTPIITVEHLGDNRIIHSNLPLVGDPDKKRLIKYTLKKGDIVFSRVGSVDRCAFVHESEDGWMFSGRLLRVRTNESLVNSRFLSFYFSQESFKDTIRMIAVGATMPSINTGILSDVDILLPALPDQRAIASVLSSLDDKIDLLHHQNKTLEGLATALWRKMFVEEASEDWKKTSVGEVIFVKGGTTPSSNNPDFWNGDVPWTSPRDLSSHDSVYMFDTSRKITQAGLAQIGSGLLPTGSVLLSSRAPIGYLVITDIEVAINQGYVGIICDKGVSNYYMFIWIRHNMDTIIGAANGSTFLEISKSVFKELEFILPSEEVLESYNSQVSPLFNKIRNNQLQIRSISKLRDALLPKLMSGEAGVKL